MFEILSLTRQKAEKVQAYASTWPLQIEQIIVSQSKPEN